MERVNPRRDKKPIECQCRSWTQVSFQLLFSEGRESGQMQHMLDVPAPSLQLASAGKSRGVSRLLPTTQPLLSGTNYHIAHWQRRRHPRCPPNFQRAQSPRQNSGRNIWRERHCWEGRPQRRPLFQKSGVPLKINESCQKWKQTERSVLVTVSDTQLAGVSNPSCFYPCQS